LKVDFAAGGLAGPETEIVGGRGVVAGNGDVVGNGGDDLTAVPGGDEPALVVGMLADVAVELNLDGVSRSVSTISSASASASASTDLGVLSGDITHVNCHIMAGKLPRVEVEPVVGHLDLVALDDFLLEDAVAVSQTVAPGRIVERGEAVKEAGGKTSKTAIAQGGIMLVFNNVLNAEAQIGEAGWM